MKRSRGKGPIDLSFMTFLVLAAMAVGVQLFISWGWIEKKPLPKPSALSSGKGLEAKPER